MGYSNYKNLRQTLKKLELEEIDMNLFPLVQTVEPSEWLQQCLSIAERLPITNEKGKSERIIAPILAEIALQYESQITLFSGEDLPVDAERDLFEDSFFLQNTQENRFFRHLFFLS